jgi:hypothetical protein
MSTHQLGRLMGMNVSQQIVTNSKIQLHDRRTPFGKSTLKIGLNAQHEG